MLAFVRLAKISTFGPVSTSNGLYEMVPLGWEGLCLWRILFLPKPKSQVLNVPGLFHDLSFPYLLLIILQFPVYHSIVS